MDEGDSAGGSCSQCQGNADCEEGATCTELTAGKYCLRRCLAEACGEGYVCRRSPDGGLPLCMPQFGGCCVSDGVGVSGAAEICNGIDDDCDGAADEDFDACFIAGACVVAGTRSAEGCGVCSPDVNPVDWSDLFFNNHQWGGSYEISSYMYWGGPDGFDPVRRTSLPSTGGYAHVIADLDGDGWPDLVTTNHRDDDGYDANLDIWWGSVDGFDVNDRTSLPTLGATGVSVADLDRDGYLDIIVSNHTDGVTTQIDSYVYWGDPDGFDAANRRLYPTVGSRMNTVADLDRDGYLDIVFANEQDDGNYDIDSYIYYGEAGGPDAGNHEDIATMGARDASVADLDGDGWPDLVFANHTDGVVFKIRPYLYYGSGNGFPGNPQKRLDTRGATSISIADLNYDGFLDILVPQVELDGSLQDESILFWGQDGGLDEDVRRFIPSPAAEFGQGRDLGATGDRAERYIYTTVSWDAGEPMFAGRLSRQADVPDHTGLRMQIQGAVSEIGLAAVNFVGPDGTVDTWFTDPQTALPATLDGNRHWQVEFTRDRPVYGPVLDSVTLEVGP